MNEEKFDRLYESANVTGDGSLSSWDFGYIWSYAVSSPDFQLDDIAEIISIWSESPEGYASLNTCILVKLNDGSFGGIDAWCDTTGWDCQSGGVVISNSSIESLARNMGDEWRNRLGYDSDLQKP
jgi:hypothetical protein